MLSFPVSRWLDTEEGDGRIELDLLPNQKPINPKKDNKTASQEKDESMRFFMIHYFVFLLKFFLRGRT
jgi:hypothetical protein